MKWIGERVSFNDTKESISFIIYPPNLGKKKYLLVAWLILWLVIGIYVSLQFYKEHTDQEQIVLIVFMSFWLYYAIRVFRTILFLFWGREYIKLDETSLRIKKATGSYGRAQQYFIENISKFKLIELKETSLQRTYDNSPWVRGTDRIEFKYYEKGISFGRKLEEKDAELVYKTILRRLEKYMQTKRK